MTHFLLCDDDLNALETLSKHIREFYNGNCQITPYLNPLKALLFLEGKPKVDMVFLDILMPELSGTTLAQTIRDKGYKGSIVFTTSSNDYAAQSYQVQALNYLLKPTAKEDITKLLTQFESQRLGSQRGITIQKKNLFRKIAFKDIMYLEVIGHYLYFHLADGETLKLYAALSEYLDELLSCEKIAQCHRSYLVNLDYVSSFSRTNVVMNDLTPISISRSFRSFQDKCVKHLFSK